MTEMLGKPPDYTDKGRQLASVEIQISGGPRPFAVEGLASRFLPNMSTSQARCVGSTTPSNRAIATTHIKYAIDEGLGLTAEQINTKARRKPLDAEVRNPNGPYEEVVPFDGKLERPAAHDARHRRSVRADLSRADAEEGGGSASGNRTFSRSASTASPATAQFSQPEMIKSFDDLVKWVRERREAGRRRGARAICRNARPNDSPAPLTAQRSGNAAVVWSRVDRSGSDVAKRGL